MWETYRIKLKNHSVLRNGNWPFTVRINGSIDCKMFAVEYFFLIQVRNFLRQNTIFFSVWSPKPQIYFPFKRTKIHSYYHVNLTLALGFFSHAAALVWPQWWSFADVSQQGLIIIFDLTITEVHMGRRKVPKSDFQSQFSMSKIIRVVLTFFSLKNISLEECFLL